jgi:hypothetical protein
MFQLLPLRFLWTEGFQNFIKQDLLDFKNKKLENLKNLKNLSNSLMMDMNVSPE